jgi:hypothetical protein
MNGLIPLLIIIALLAWAGRRCSASHADGCLSQPRHPAVRWICATLGIGILAALAVGSWRAAHVPYLTTSGTAAMMLAPVRSAPLPVGEDHLTPSIPSLFQLRVFLVPSGNPALCRHHQEWTVRWPEDRGHEWLGEWDDGTRLAVWRFTISDVQTNNDGTAPVRFTVATSYMFGSSKWPHRHSSSSSNDSDSLSTTGKVLDLAFTESWCNRPFAIGRTWDPALVLFVALTPLAADEPMVQQPVADILATYGDQLRSRPEQQQDSDIVPAENEHGVALAGHLGLALLPLLASVVLLVQCFRRRAIALVGITMAVLLVVIALDRVVLDVHLAHLDDARASSGERQIAGHNASDSFFHRATALRHLGAVAADPDAPQALRDACAALLPPSAR